MERKTLAGDALWHDPEGEWVLYEEAQAAIRDAYTKGLEDAAFHAKAAIAERQALEDAARAIADTLATPRPMSEAPRDGTKVLAWWPTHGEWLPTWGNEIVWRTIASTWTYHGEKDAPTHFLPHPETPHGS